MGRLTAHCASLACAMEKDEDYFMEISLDSVLRKATELEVSLRVCKARAETSPPAEPAEEGRISQPLVAATTTTRVPASVDLTDQWQKLTAYIVSLEKEVQYYKQLLQDVQASQNTEVTEVTDTTDCPVGGQHLVSSQTKGQEGEMNKEYWKTLMDKDSWTHALLSVFSYLSRQELCRASLVCRKWYRMSRHPQLWKEVIMSETIVEPEVRSHASIHGSPFTTKLGDIKRVLVIKGSLQDCSMVFMY